MTETSYFPKRFIPYTLFVAIAMLTVPVSHANLRADEPLGVQVPEGFEVTLYADDDLAHDIYSMTIDSFGRVVVSGAGYVKTLIDSDGDGKADQSSLFLDGPKSGLQGMYFAGHDLIASGDGGLVRYRDANHDNQADGPPDVFWKIKTGGEHDLHAIRKGPDGWWYVLAGNMAGVDERFVKLPTSPVKKPNAGTLLRFTPDLTKSEIYADGFRNAYDFDFGHAGDLFTFDSDGERDVSLPWYRPTRVFHVVAGSNAGWFSRSWKRPESFFDMPPVVGAFGRGSPTGVECYRHTQFPKEYHGALFVLDWTYGRVIAMPMQTRGSTWKSEPIEFMTAVGQHGFAPTDAIVGPDGSLYVSVGGRGTRGGVYRITAKNDSPLGPKLPFGVAVPSGEQARIELCLNAPQPLSSWSRRVWEPIVAKLESGPFILAAQDQTRPVSQRVRAIEILTEKFDGLDDRLVAKLIDEKSPQIRARVAWSICRTNLNDLDQQIVANLLVDEDHYVSRTAMESLMGADSDFFSRVIEPIGQQLGSDDRYLRQAATHLIARSNPETIRDIAAVGFKLGWQAAIPVAVGFAQSQSGFQPYTIDIARRALLSDADQRVKLEAARVLQIGLGDLFPGTDAVAPVYDGYASPVDLSVHATTTEAINKLLEEIYPTKNSKLDWELERVMAMIESSSGQLLGDVVAKITKNSEPVDDIHRLIVLSRMTAQRTEQQRSQIATGLVAIEQKIEERNLRQDSNWADRTLEMYIGLVEKDPQLPLAVLQTPGFGHPGHVQLISQFPPEKFDEAIAAFSKQARENREYAWNADVVFLLAESFEPEDQKLVRSQFDDFALRGAVVASLAVDPKESDRDYFYRVLESSDIETMKECIMALGLLRPTQNAEENVALVRTLRLLSSSGEERQVRDQIIELLRRNLGEEFGYSMGRDRDPQASAIAAWTKHVQGQFPEEYQAQAGSDGEGLDELKARLAKIDWSGGNPSTGEVLFKSRGCIQCHGGRSALGPDLTGVAGRFSRDDLFTAIAYPNRDVSPRYQTTQIATLNGKVLTGLIVYESVDGLVLRDSNNRTYRVESDDIEIRQRLSKSLMPVGLLKGLSDEELTHLYAYLQTLGVRQTATPTRSASRAE